ncbi:diguanylate cyclase [Sphingomonas mollis]|uniref:diguanylate cyclase n=1 Tax=Sphingomonas mollis TaxID=2795726 RepID=A0ABS0XQX2_9SPHN|nr:diguanylate cyclase [Sphingomonas sp. BT553]MBJ6122190.1 diguanylate cyclase [Sphingomonas sp. BT553]
MMGRVTRLVFWGWLTLLACAVTAGPATASTSLSVCMIRAAPGMTPQALFVDPGRFDCVTPQKHFGRGDFWLLSQPLPDLTADHPPFSVRFAGMWRERTTLYTLYADGAIERSSFTSRTTGQFLRPGGMIRMPLAERAAPPVRLLWHIRGAGNMRGVLVEPTLVDRPEGDRTELLFAIFYASFAGMAVALIVYNLALWAALRQGFQPVYCLMLLSLICYSIMSSGAIGLWWPGIDNELRLRLAGFFLGTSGASVLLFARFFFERRVFAGWLAWATDLVMVALVGSTAIFALLAPWHINALDNAVTISFLLLAIVVLAILVQAWRRRSNYLWLFAIAWGVPIVMGCFRIASSFGLVRWHIWTDHSTILAMALEAVLSSLGIAYRIRLLSRERDQAREQEVVARELADVDPLTGLFNRRAFLRQAIGRPGAQTLLIADLDHFKHINETIGHDGGDEVLRSFARALSAAVPAGALVARIGGEEFAVVGDADAGAGAGAGPGIDGPAILHALRHARMPFDLTVTCSIGTCTGPLLREADWKALYRDADRALYAAKAAGRDRARDATTSPVAA